MLCAAPGVPQVLVKTICKLGDGDKGNPAGVGGEGAGPASPHSGPEVSWTSSKAVGGAAAAVPAGAWPWPLYKGAACQLGQTSRWPNDKSASPLARPIDAGCRVEPCLPANGKICGRIGRGGLRVSGRARFCAPAVQRAGGLPWGCVPGPEGPGPARVQAEALRTATGTAPRALRDPGTPSWGRGPRCGAAHAALQVGWGRGAGPAEDKGVGALGAGRDRGCRLGRGPVGAGSWAGSRGPGGDTSPAPPHPHVSRTVVRETLDWRGLVPLCAASGPCPTGRSAPHKA